MNQVESYILERDPLTAELMMAVRKIILRSSPAISENIKYGIPFFTYSKPLCYLNPVKGGVNLGFVDGVKLSNAQGALSGDGKTVRHLFLPIEGRIPEKLILETLYEALLLKEHR